MSSVKRWNCFLGFLLWEQSFSVATEYPKTLRIDFPFYFVVSACCLSLQPMISAPTQSRPCGLMENLCFGPLESWRQASLVSLQRLNGFNQKLILPHCIILSPHSSAFLCTPRPELRNLQPTCQAFCTIGSSKRFTIPVLDIGSLGSCVQDIGVEGLAHHLYF